VEATSCRFIKRLEAVATLKRLEAVSTLKRLEAVATLKRLEAVSTLPLSTFNCERKRAINS